jgi:diacylglycerol kinase (ATP)
MFSVIFGDHSGANPQMLNSRFKNRIAYGGLGTIDLFKRSWRDLSDFMTLEVCREKEIESIVVFLQCDGQELTAKIREFKFHCILFHNITYYACGTVPWGSDHTSDNMTRPSCCDGLIEVLGFTTATLVG